MSRVGDLFDTMFESAFKDGHVVIAAASAFMFNPALQDVPYPFSFAEQMVEYAEDFLQSMEPHYPKNADRISCGVCDSVLCPSYLYQFLGAPNQVVVVSEDPADVQPDEQPQDPS